MKRFLFLGIALLCPWFASAVEPTAPSAAFDWFDYTGRDAVFQAPLAPNTYQNPILAGFYPDPSVCRVGDDFYLVNSSFAFFPGVPIFHSRDLVQWRQIGHVLDRPGQLKLDGLGVSRGIFAPTIRFYHGKYYVITTLVDGGGNFFVTANNPAGPWSDPVWLPEIDGIDPSFFFDEDGKAYVINNGPPPGNKPLYSGHRAIWIQQFDIDTQKLVGPRKIVVNGGVNLAAKPVWIEGPHIFKRKNWYYLTCAEGGTGPEHSQVIFRSHSPMGPYTPWEKNPVITQRTLPPDRQNPVTCTGHADFVEGLDGTWWAVFLGCRPYQGDLYNTGRETFLLPVTWHDDWPTILDPKTVLPMRPQLPSFHARNSSGMSLTGNFTWRDQFDSRSLNPVWNLLRTPAQPWWDFHLIPGSLVLEARAETLNGTGNPSFLGHRQQHAAFDASLKVHLPSNGASAGIAAFQNETHHFFLGLRRQGSGAEVFLERMASDKPGEPEQVAAASLPDGIESAVLKISGNGAKYSFSYDAGDEGWKTLKADEDGTILSTSVAGGFVGSHVGPYVRLDGKK